jgi:hypothetical protein
LNGVPEQDHPVGHSWAELQRCVQVLPTQWPPEQLETHGPPTSGCETGRQVVAVERELPSRPLMHTRPPWVVASHTQSKGQSFAVVQAFVQMKEGLMPKQSPDWQSLPVEQSRPRSLTEHVGAPPPPPVEGPPPEPPHVEGPALLPPTKPPLDRPSQQVPKPAHAPGHAWAPS